MKKIIATLLTFLIFFVTFFIVGIIVNLVIKDPISEVFTTSLSGSLALLLADLFMGIIPIYRELRLSFESVFDKKAVPKVTASRGPIGYFNNKPKEDGGANKDN